MPDASAVMQLLLKTQTDFNDLEDDDPQVGEDLHVTLSSLCILKISLASSCACVCMLFYFLWFRYHTWSQPGPECARSWVKSFSNTWLWWWAHLWRRPPSSQRWPCWTVSDQEDMTHNPMCRVSTCCSLIHMCISLQPRTWRTCQRKMAGSLSIWETNRVLALRRLGWRRRPLPVRCWWAVWLW